MLGNTYSFNQEVHKFLTVYSQEVVLASMQEIPGPFWILIYGPWNIFATLHIASFLGKKELNVFQVAIMKLSAVHKYA